jgi:hypothetical protein
MEIYTTRLIKARAVQSELLHDVLRRYYPTAWDFIPVSLLLEARSFRVAHEEIEQDVFEKDAVLGKTFYTLMLDILVPGQVLKVNQSVPSPTNNFLNLAEANLWLGGEYRQWSRSDRLDMQWQCDYLFTKRRADGSVRRHAPPHIGGRILHELKYPKFVQILQPTEAELESVSTMTRRPVKA